MVSPFSGCKRNNSGPPVQRGEVREGSKKFPCDKRVMHDIFRPETFANSFITSFKEKSRIFRVGQWRDFLS